MTRAQPNVGMQKTEKLILWAGSGLAPLLMPGCLRLLVYCAVQDEAMQPFAYGDWSAGALGLLASTLAVVLTTEMSLSRKLCMIFLVGFLLLIAATVVVLQALFDVGRLTANTIGYFVILTLALIASVGLDAYVCLAEHRAPPP